MTEKTSTLHPISTPTQVFKPYPAINKPKFSHATKQTEGLVIIQPAKVVDITPPKPKSFDFKGDFFDRYYKEGWKDKDVKYSHGTSGDEDKIPDFLKYAIPMPMSQRRMDVSIHSVAKSPKMFGSSW